MSRAAGMAWANFVSSLGASAPGIARQFNEDSERNKKLRDASALKASVQDIITRMPQVESPVLNEITDPEEAKRVLASLPEENKQEAVSLMGAKGLDAMRLKMPSTIPERPGMGSAISTLTKQGQEPFDKDKFIDKFMGVTANKESNGKDIGLHPMAKNGYQAVGRFGVVPSLHMHRVGLDSNKKADVERFNSSPELQAGAARDLIAELGDRYDWDPLMMRKGYYGITGKPDAPQYLADGRAMPSGNQDSSDFMDAWNGLGSMAAFDGGQSGKLPWDNSLLDSLTSEKPTMKTMPKKVSYGDQERYLLSKIKSPEQYAALKDMLSSVSGLAKSERDSQVDAEKNFQDENRQYGENVRANSRLKFDTWKEGNDTKNRRYTANRASRNESLGALRQQRDSMHKQLQDLRAFQTRASSGKEDTEILSAAYPEFYTNSTKQPTALETMLHGDNAEFKPVTTLDLKKVKDAATSLEQNINAIDQALSGKSNADVIQMPASTKPELSKYLKPRK